MRRAWKILFALLFGAAATLATGQVQSAQSGLLCASPAGSCQVIRSYGFPLAWRTVVSYIYPQRYSCPGPLERDCILPTDPPLRYDLITFLLDTLFLSTVSYGLILIAALSRSRQLAGLPRRVSTLMRKAAWFEKSWENPTNYTSTPGLENLRVTSLDQPHWLRIS